MWGLNLTSVFAKEVNGEIHQRCLNGLGIDFVVAGPSGSVGEVDPLFLVSQAYLGREAVVVYILQLTSAVHQYGRNVEGRNMTWEMPDSLVDSHC
jgi:hypothetical protein